MMISPQGYIAQFEEASYAELITERGKLICQLEELERTLQSPDCLEVIVYPGPDVQYKVTLDYLAELIALMSRRASELTGEEESWQEDEDE